jgi:hypothetical protein
MTKTIRIIELTTEFVNPNRDRRRKDWTGEDTIKPGRYIDDGHSVRRVGASRYAQVLNANWREKEQATYHAIVKMGTEVAPVGINETLTVLDAKDEAMLILGLFMHDRVINTDMLREAAVTIRMSDDDFIERL